MKHNKLLRIYIILTGGAISSVGLLHLLRIIYQVPVVVGELSIPIFLSYLGLVASIGITTLAMWLFFRK
jgi:hypothetical protein